MPAIQAVHTQQRQRELLQELRDARRQSDLLFDVIRPDAIYDRPIAARNRVIFYVGHLDGFDSILICERALGLKSSDAEFDSLFQRGIDPEPGQLPSDKVADWPKLEQVRSYVDRCRRHVDDYLADAPEDVIVMAIEHRLMHMETLAYMFHNFSYERKRVPENGFGAVTSGELASNVFLEIPGGDATLGCKRGVGFHWDNEYEQWSTPVPPFEIQKYSVSNAEYLKFVQDGGPWPHFWVERNGVIYWRGMFAEFKLPLNWPVYVTQRQAASYAEWLGATLPSEEQLDRATYGFGEQSEVIGNYNFERWDPVPVNAYDGTDTHSIKHLVGNGWQWTRTPFGPFPGFSPDPKYPGYSADFFDNQHFVLKGASPRTASRLVRRSFRNWFRPEYPYVYATFRCVKE